MKNSPPAFTVGKIAVGWMALLLCSAPLACGDRRSSPPEQSAQEAPTPALNSQGQETGPPLGVHDGVAPDERQTVTVGETAVAAPTLVPHPQERVTFPPGASPDEKIAILANEIERLKQIATRATVVVTAELELAEAKNRQGAIVTLTGGKLAQPVTCETNQYGSCVFIVEPLADLDPPYRARIEARNYLPTEKEFRVGPAALAQVSTRVEMAHAAREARIHPRQPTPK